MHDPTENMRRGLVGVINEQVESMDEDNERKRLEAKVGEVWDTKEVQKVFEITAFLAPFVQATHRETGKVGTLMFQHMPRFYFMWKTDD
jgi:hypothetical protein